LKLVLDTGALLALERNDRSMWRRFKAAQLSGSVVVTHGGIVGQAWRGRGPRAALLAKALAGIEIRALDEALGRAAGELLAATRRADVVDAAFVLLGDDGDHLVTSDAGDIEPLAAAAGRHVEIFRV
jgi:hypothetical protein